MRLLSGDRTAPHLLRAQRGVKTSEEEDFLDFGVGAHGGQSFQSSPSDPCRESSRQEGGFDEKRDRRVDAAKAGSQVEYRALPPNGSFLPALFRV